MAQWSKESAVRREDQFTAAPEFIDGHESRHLPMWGRIGAAWHGMSAGRRVVLMASLVVLSTVGGAGMAFTLDDFGREVGTQPGVSGPAGAHGAPAPLEVPAVGPEDLLNGTAAPPGPSP